MQYRYFFRESLGKEHIISRDILYLWKLPRRLRSRRVNCQERCHPLEAFYASLTMVTLRLVCWVANGSLIHIKSRAPRKIDTDPKEVRFELEFPEIINCFQWAKRVSGTNKKEYQSSKIRSLF